MEQKCHLLSQDFFDESHHSLVCSFLSAISKHVLRFVVVATVEINKSKHMLTKATLNNIFSKSDQTVDDTKP